MQRLHKILVVLAATTLAIFAIQPIAQAATKPNVSSVTWAGNGTSFDGSTRQLTTELCAPDPAAEETGTYVVFVLAATKNFTSAPTIQFGAGTPRPMTKSNGTKRGASTFKYILLTDEDFNLQTLFSDGVVAANFGSATPTLTISHGCSDSTSGLPYPCAALFTCSIDPAVTRS